jgi:hypothetical protein
MKIRLESLSRSWCSALLRVLPTLINEFKAVAIGVQYIGSVVARIIVESCRGRTVVGGSCCDGGSVRCVDLIPVVGNKANMCLTAVRYTFTNPEEQATVCTEAFEIWVSRRPKLTVEIKTLIDTKRRQCRFIKRNRAFHIAHS